MASQKSRKKVWAEKIKSLLDATEELSQRQVDMVVAAAMTMTDAAIETIIAQLEADPEGILKDIKTSSDES